MKTVTFVFGLDCDPDAGYGEHVSLDLVIDVLQHQQKKYKGKKLKMGMNNNVLEIYYKGKE